MDPGLALYRRLKEHTESIKQASNLDIRSFQCRYLVVDDIWIPLGEALLIAKFSPIWNKVVDGLEITTPEKDGINNLDPDGILCIQDVHGRINARNVRKQQNKLRKRLSLTWKPSDMPAIVIKFAPHAFTILFYLGNADSGTPLART
ncbi:MAG: Eco29kI family restriction endonuclease [Desulfofustis sp. PB-SRB1]|nr:Eco29kI family restriction endonuclease [Desulfofustis sp. PB-SRB1]